MYVTPERFRTMGFGLDLDGVEDFELRAILRRASDRVNTICAAPARPVTHDFRGGSITGEEHLWESGNGVSTGSQRTVFLWHYPIKAVSLLRIHLTNQQYIGFSAGELYVSERSVEITSLAMTANGLFGAFIVPQIGLLHPRVRVDYTYGHAIPKTNEVLEATDGKLFRAQHQSWTEDPVVVYVGGTEVETGFTLDRIEGVVLFEESQGPDTIVTADYTTSLPDGIATATAILAAEALGDREMRARGMSGLRAVRVGEIALEKETAMRGATTLVTPAQAEAESYLAPHHFLWAG